MRERHRLGRVGIAIAIALSHGFGAPAGKAAGSEDQGLRRSRRVGSHDRYRGLPNHRVPLERQPARARRSEALRPRRMQEIGRSRGACGPVEHRSARGADFGVVGDGPGPLRRGRSPAVDSLRQASPDGRLSAGKNDRAFRRALRQSGSGLPACASWHRALECARDSLLLEGLLRVAARDRAQIANRRSSRERDAGGGRAASRSRQRGLGHSRHTGQATRGTRCARAQAG